MDDLAFCATRHRFLDGSFTGNSASLSDWRLRTRMRTVGAALVVCLNIGVDPPDVLKTDPCARTEAWMDPMTLPPQKALSSIGNRLQKQYERWQPRALYKLALDQTDEELRNLCISLRRAARSERALFHFNGHGVPRPTANGEIWVFNKNYTQYIPISLYDLNSWLGAPAIYVFDCSGAGILLEALQQIRRNAGQQGETEEEAEEIIALAACAENQLLPMNPDLPADLFTSCLTTPIKMALKWFASRSMLCQVSSDQVDKLPGRPNDRKSPFGELNWIFTAVTDTIAWNVLPPHLFQQLFRQDLLVASLFRNFLLAERIMKPLNCTVMSVPKLPTTSTHPLWESWDLATEFCLAQLSKFLKDDMYIFEPSSFFSDQLTAFEVSLDLITPDKKPMQLPIVLQVLLSQSHRLRALQLLARFLDKGPWAVNLALSVGIFPYVLKLLQSPTPELRDVLVFIWAKILVLDKSCTADLIKEQYHRYFIRHLSGSSDPDSGTSNDSISPIQCILNLFILSVLSDNDPNGQSEILAAGGLHLIQIQVSSNFSFVRRWACLSLAKLWKNNEKVQWAALKEKIPEKLAVILYDKSPEVRAAAVFAIGNFFGSSRTGDENDYPIERQVCDLRLGLEISSLAFDGSPLVREQLILALGSLIVLQKTEFVKICKWLEEKDSSLQVTQNLTSLPGQTPSDPNELRWICLKAVLTLRLDSFPRIGDIAEFICFKLLRLTLSTPLSPQMSKDRFSLTTADPSSQLSVSSQSSKSPVRSLGTSNSFSTGSYAIAPVDSSEGQITMQSSSHASRRRVQTIVEQKEIQFTDEVEIEVDKILSSNLYDWNAEIMNFPLLATGKDNLFQASNASSMDYIFDTSSIELDLNATYFDYGSEDIQVCLDQLAEDKWTEDRNSQVLSEALSLQTSYDSRPLDDQVAIFHTEFSETSRLLFHPYEPILVATDSNQRIGIWNYEDGDKLNFFSNNSFQSSCSGTRISAMTFVNELSRPYLLTGSNDGIVRVWRNFQCDQGQKLVSSWLAIPNMRSGKQGMVLDWQQYRNRLLAIGGAQQIRVWDVELELCSSEISLSSGVISINSVCSDSTGDVIYFGCGDGSVRFMDLRSPRDASSSGVVCEHGGRVVSVCLQRKGECNGLLVSGGIRGNVYVSDLRYPKISPAKFRAHPSSPLNTLAVHDYAPVMASGSSKQFVKVMRTDGVTINKIRHYDGFLGQRIGPVNYLAFHPYKLLLGVGGRDSYVSIYAVNPSGSA